MGDFRRRVAQGPRALCNAFHDAAGTMKGLELDKDPLAVKVDLVELTARDKEGKQLTLGLQVSGLLINPPGS